MIRLLILAVLLPCGGCVDCERLTPAAPGPMDEAREFLVSWIEEIGPKKFIALGHGYESFLPVEQWEIGIDGQFLEDSCSFELGVYYPYRDEESGRILKDLLGAVVKKEGGEWAVVRLLY